MEFDASKVGAALGWAREQLTSVEDIDQPQQEAELILATVLRLTRAQLLGWDDSGLSEAQALRFAQLVTRRAHGEPFAYLAGEREFWTLTLRVTPDVLVPRPETELLVERALHRGGQRTALEVADLGTGCGCIALALASERPRWRITATDVSAAALDVARENAARLQLPTVEFVISDWFANLTQRRFALLLSNPPYIAATDSSLLHGALRFEPQLALTPGADGLAALQTLCTLAPPHLLSGGALMLEHGAGQADAVRGMLVARGFAQVTSHCDLAGIERVTEGTWCS